MIRPPYGVPYADLITIRCNVSVYAVHTPMSIRQSAYHTPTIRRMIRRLPDCTFCLGLKVKQRNK